MNARNYSGNHVKAKINVFKVIYVIKDQSYFKIHFENIFLLVVAPVCPQKRFSLNRIRSLYSEKQDLKAGRIYDVSVSMETLKKGETFILLLTQTHTHTHTVTRVHSCAGLAPINR